MITRAMRHVVRWISVLIVFGIMADLLHVSATVLEDYALCMNNSICRQLYLQSASPQFKTTQVITGMRNDQWQRERFLYDSHSVDMKMNLLVGSVQAPLLSTDQRLRLYELILHKKIFSEDQCPPNTFWRWSATSEKGECACYLDRDCRVETTAVCSDVVIHAHLVLTIIFIVLVVVSIIVRTMVDRYAQ
jgi:hypothetical protein